MHYVGLQKSAVEVKSLWHATEEYLLDMTHIMSMSREQPKTLSLHNQQIPLLILNHIY